MSRDYKVYLEDILKAIDKIQKYTSGLDKDKLAADEKTLDAVLLNLEVVGEAVKNVPDEVRLAHPEVEWKKMAGLRDILVHEYFGINLEIVWDIVQNKLPPLRNHIKDILSK